MTFRVVRAFLNDHEVVAVNCSPLPTRPWTAVDMAKGWTIACREEDLVRPVEFAGVPKDVITGGKASKEQLQALADIMGIPDLPRIVDEGLAKIKRGVQAAFDEDRWRVTSCDDDPYTGEAPEAWAYVVDRIDRYGFVDRVEHHVDGSWRIRSIRDLLEAAGGDPL